MEDFPKINEEIREVAKERKFNHNNLIKETLEKYRDQPRNISRRVSKNTFIKKSNNKIIYDSLDNIDS